MYGQYLYLSANENFFWSSQTVTVIIIKYENGIANLQNDQLITNNTLLRKAIKAKKVNKKRVKK